MEAILGFAVLAVLAVGVMALANLRDWLINAFTGSATRRLRPNAHREGQAFVDTLHTFVVDAPTPKLLQALTDGVTTRTSAPTMSFGETYISGITHESIQWSHGTSLRTDFRALLHVVKIQRANGEEEPAVALAFEHTIRNGLVAELTHMKKLKAAIAKTLATLDPNAREVEHA